QLIPALDRLNVPFTESHFHLFDVRSGRAIPAPVITWASRSAVRRTASVLAAAIARRRWANRPVGRIALHPGDFDHPPIVASISQSLDALLSSRRAVTVHEAFDLA